MLQEKSDEWPHESNDDECKRAILYISDFQTDPRAPKEWDISFQSTHTGNRLGTLGGRSRLSIGCAVVLNRSRWLAAFHLELARSHATTLRSSQVSRRVFAVSQHLSPKGAFLTATRSAR